MTHSHQLDNKESEQGRHSVSILSGEIKVKISVAKRSSISNEAKADTRERTDSTSFTEEDIFDVLDHESTPRDAEDAFEVKDLLPEKFYRLAERTSPRASSNPIPIPSL